MTTYVAFLRGIMPSNPNMRNEKLRGVFESLGFTGVQTVISSGNVIFKAPEKATPKNISALELRIERALFDQLGIKSPAYIRSQEELEALIKKDPFKGAEHGRKTYLIVSFLKKEQREIFNSIDISNPKIPNFMATLEKEHSKDVTTRTWKTVERIHDKMLT